MGGSAFGYAAIGGGASGYYAFGGGAFGVHTWSAAVQDPEAHAFFRQWLRPWIDAFRGGPGR